MYLGNLSDLLAPTLAINVDGLILTKPRAFPRAVKWLERSPWTAVAALHMYEINSVAYRHMERLAYKHGYNFIFIAHRPKSTQDVFRSFFKDWPVLGVYCLDTEAEVEEVLRREHVMRYYYTRAEHYVFRHAHKCRRVSTWFEIITLE